MTEKMPVMGVSTVGFNFSQTPDTTAKYNGTMTWNGELYVTPQITVTRKPRAVLIACVSANTSNFGTAVVWFNDTCYEVGHLGATVYDLIPTWLIVTDNYVQYTDTTQYDVNVRIWY